MTVTDVARQAFSKGLDEGGLKRVRRSWMLRATPLRWVVHIDNRKWAGLAVEASLFWEDDDDLKSGRSLLLATLFMETLPISDDVERKQALYLQSAIADDVRAERLTVLAREFAELICGLDSLESLRRAESEGWFSYGFVSPLFMQLISSK